MLWAEHCMRCEVLLIFLPGPTLSGVLNTDLRGKQQCVMKHAGMVCTALHAGQHMLFKPNPQHM